MSITIMSVGDFSLDLGVVKDDVREMIRQERIIAADSLSKVDGEAQFDNAVRRINRLRLFLEYLNDIGDQIATGE